MSDKDDDEPKLEPTKSPVSARRAKKLLYLSEYLSKQESRTNCKKVSKILKKSAHEHTEDEKATLAKHQDIVKRISKNKEKRELNQQRVLETEDGEEVLQTKCEKLAKIIQQSKKTVIYTGAGISTAASIPDYRGPQGVWTLLQKGEQLKPQDLSDAEPTLTHMCITQLHKLGHVKHVVSQNCDGLHLRSGLPRQVLSEVHGNMFIEICHNCRPHREYVRLFDVTENTGVRRHLTGRHCQRCGGKLKDTIVHFGEKGGMKSPYRWKEAVRAANKCDLILCLGSSLKILKKYACLWCMDRVKHKRPKLAIVNLQWTPKDESATLKINGRCDDVLERVMKILKYDVPEYSRKEDPIFSLATCLAEEEEETTNKKVLQIPDILPRLRSHGISRTPTPSDSSDSQSSLTSSTDSCDTPEDLTCVNTARPRSIRNFNFKNFRFDPDPDTKVETINSEEMCFSKSERICNEAKIAMQERLVNAKINEMYGVCSNMQGENSNNKTFGLNGMVMIGNHQSDGFVEQQPKVQYDPLRGGPFDPGPASHEEKLKYLQMLQVQLEELKMKQKVLKEQEQQHLKKQRQPQQKQDVVKQVSQVGKLENTLLKQEPDKPRAVKQDKNKTTLLKTQDIEKEKIKAEVQKSNLKHFSAEKTSPHQQSSQHTDQVNIDFNSANKAVTKNPRIIAMEQKLTQNTAEQKKLKKTLSAMLTDQQKAEEQTRVQHQNEQLRLHQHFLIQEQLRQQTKESKSKKEEILKLFVFQQQSLLAQQNLQLQCLRQTYTTEVQKFQTVLNDLKTAQDETVKKLKALKSELRNKEMPSVIKNPIATNTAGSSLLQTKDTVKLVTQVGESPMVSPKLKSPKKDHSIASILEGNTDHISPNKSNVTSDTGTAGNVQDQSKTCESCKFLNDYGMRKKWCTKCDELKCYQGAASSKQSLANPKYRVDSTFLEHVSVPKLQNTPNDVSSTLENPNEQDFPIYNYVLDLEIPEVYEPKSEGVVSSDGGKIEHTDHDYLISKNNSEQKVKDNSGITVCVNSEKHKSIDHPKGQAVPISVSTSNAIVTVSENCNPNLVSPIIPHASENFSVKVSDTSKRLRHVAADSEKNVTYKTDKRNSVSSSKIPERVTFSLGDNIKDVSDRGMSEEIDRNSESKVKPSCAVKHVRSHSQSEIYDKKQDEETLKPSGVRHTRCWSHSEISAAEEGSGVDNEDSNDVASGASEEKEESENSVKGGKKRKLARCLSVPGWFGKGLNIKKRRKY
ncbi:uncharacterized protein LOC123563565 [Mercenaria mercenaria]|uniref:uncharacterized protein LOC123563565 n=1 Tax=Mercenaria mercenaria TaxID=6596 RepID=UPI00234E4E48|nr:uncharacterized protein LOC123563565 [Mercenaria mercenaria]